MVGVLVGGCLWQTFVLKDVSSVDFSWKSGAKADTVCERQIFAMDTIMTLTAYGKNGEKAVEEAVEEINRLDALLSTG
ncbi:MAG: hypothetical protein KBT01_06510, partial [Clostridiales bacterium]|nr:hypothetical protein [Candidatus Blautia equi]